MWIVEVELGGGYGGEANIDGFAPKPPAGLPVDAQRGPAPAPRVGVGLSPGWTLPDGGGGSDCDGPVDAVLIHVEWACHRWSLPWCSPSVGWWGSSPFSSGGRTRTRAWPSRCLRPDVARNDDVVGRLRRRRHALNLIHFCQRACITIFLYILY